MDMIVLTVPSQCLAAWDNIRSMVVVLHVPLVIAVLIPFSAQKLALLASMHPALALLIVCLVRLVIVALIPLPILFRAWLPHSVPVAQLVAPLAQTALIALLGQRIAMIVQPGVPVPLLVL